MDIKILTILDSLNYMARIEKWIGALVRRRRPHEIRVTRYGDRSGRDWTRELKRLGIRTWGERTTSDYFIFSVSTKQAGWAHAAIKLIEAGKPPTPWGKKRPGKAHRKSAAADLYGVLKRVSGR